MKTKENHIQHQLMLEEHREKKYEASQRQQSPLGPKFFKRESEFFGIKPTTIPHRRPLVRMGV